MASSVTWTHDGGQGREGVRQHVRLSGVEGEPAGARIPIQYVFDPGLELVDAEESTSITVAR
ncbi:hypothetical protein MK489_25190 [Myxococcota bacterium]|nr:hypothetical protein [Myxococcota bacterium]